MAARETAIHRSQQAPGSLLGRDSLMRSSPIAERPSRLTLESLVRLERDFARPRKRRREPRRRPTRKAEDADALRCGGAGVLPIEREGAEE